MHVQAVFIAGEQEVPAHSAWRASSPPPADQQCSCCAESQMQAPGWAAAHRAEPALGHIVFPTHSSSSGQTELRQRRMPKGSENSTNLGNYWGSCPWGLAFRLKTGICKLQDLLDSSCGDWWVWLVEAFNWKADMPSFSGDSTCLSDASRLQQQTRASGHANLHVQRRSLPITVL